jgi:hypothetical protein
MATCLESIGNDFILLDQQKTKSNALGKNHFLVKVGGCRVVEVDSLLSKRNPLGIFFLDFDLSSP